MFEVSYWGVEWVEGSRNFIKFLWLFVCENGEIVDKEYLKKYYEKWVKFILFGVGVICGEGGVYKYIFYDVVIRWFFDVLDILKEFGIGIVFWNLRGLFGIIDLGREDVEYEDFYGYKFDRKFLEFL